MEASRLSVRDCRITTVSIIGAGNVAWSLAQAIDALDAYHVSEVYNHTLPKAQTLADRLENARAIARPEAISPDADIYLISVKDDAIADVAAEIPRSDSVVLHTSGGVDANVLAGASESFGVLYPLQTFTLGTTLDLRNVPLFIEGNNEKSLKAVHTLASALSNSVTVADSNKRRLMHVAAVFGCNFVNYLWTLSSQLLERNGMDFNIIEPLVAETMRKAFAVGPERGQTGPARRADATVMERHLNLLDGKYKDLYRRLSSDIMDLYNKPLGK